MTLLTASASELSTFDPGGERLRIVPDFDRQLGAHLRKVGSRSCVLLSCIAAHLEAR